MRKLSRWTGSLLAVVIGLSVSGTAFAETPNDPGYTYQAEKLGYAKIPEAWAYTTGNPALTVAVLSTGVDSDHPDLQGVLVPGYNALDGTGNVEDTAGRGTMMAGLLGAARNNGIGIAGTANVKIMPVKVDGPYVSTAKVAEGLRWAVDHGAKIIVSDMMTQSDYAVLRDAVEYAYSKGVVVVAATGDTGYGEGPEGQATYPAAYEHVIAVGGTERTGVAWWDNSDYGPYVDVLAPAQYLYTLTNDGGQAYAPYHSTAFSASLVGGIAALMLSTAPDLTPDEVEMRLQRTAKDSGSEGFDNYSGYGVVNAEAAVTYTEPVPLPDLVAMNGPNEPIYPDGLQKPVVSFTIKKPSRVNLKVVDAYGNEVRTLLIDQEFAAGDQQVEWDGLNKIGWMLSGGTYTYVLDAVADGLTGQETEQETGTFVILKPDLQVKHWQRSFGVSGPSMTVVPAEEMYAWMEVYDAERQLISKITKQYTFSKNFENSLYWDGKDATGQIVSEGIYTLRAGGTTVSGREIHPVEVTTRADHTAPVMTNLETSPQPFITGKENVKISFDLSEYSMMWFDVLDSTNTSIKYDLVGPREAGEHQIEWNGLDSANKPLKEGWYKVKLTYFDRANNYGVEQFSSVYADAAQAAITSVSDSADPFKVTGTTKNTIQFRLNEAMQVKVTVLDAAGQLVRTLSDGARVAGAQSVQWDGKDAAGQLVAEGLYTYRIEAVDNFNRPVPAAEGTIYVDKTAPVVSEAVLTPNPFAPDGTSRASLSYTLSENAKVTVTLHNSAGTQIKSLAASLAQTAGTQTLSWGGTNASNVLVDDGTYTYKITATDGAGWISVINSGTFQVEGRLPTITNVKDSADPFKVTGTSTSTISYVLSEAANVKVEIHDAAGQVVRHLYAGQLTAGNKSVVWNGKDDAGALVADGTYTYQITAVDAAGKAAAPAIGTITTDKTVPVVSQLTVTSEPVDPTTGGTVGVSYALSEEAKVTVSVYNSANALVKTLLSNALQSGTQALSWDGKNSSGALVGDGVYTIKVTATDLAAWASVPVSAPVTVEGRAPELTAVSDSPNPFRPTGTTTNTIRYTLSENAAVSVTVYDEAGQAVKKLYDAQTTSGSKSLTWNGKNESGVIVASGTYTYIIKATDAFGKTTETSGTILVDVTPPAVTDLAISENPFAPLGTNTTEIRYTLGENAKVTVAVLNSSNTIIRTISSSIAQTAGNNAVLWNGKNNSNVLVTAGTYTVKVTAVDSVGNTTIQTTTLTVQ